MSNTSLPTMQLDDTFYRQVLDGTISATIRIGKRPISEGRLLFTATNGGYLPLVVYVEKVIHTTLIGIADRDAQLAGYVDGDHAREALDAFYPEAKLDTPFTVIRFERVL